MKCKRFRELLFDRAHSDVPAGERAALAEHLAACPDCSAQAAATGKVLDALDRIVPPVPFDTERGLAALRGRLAAEPPHPVAWRDLLRPFLWPAVAGLAATAAAVLLLSHPEPPASPGNGNPSVADKAPEQSPDLPAQSTLRNLLVMVEELPLYEELDLFSEHETLIGLAAADDATLDELLEEVGG